MARKKVDYTRLNLVSLPEEIGKAFEELCNAKGKKANDVFIELVKAGCENDKNKEVLEAYREQQKADAKLKALRQ